MAEHPFTLEEKACFDAIGQTMALIQDLDERGRLNSNIDELAKAIHVLQQFPIQHMLNRLWPNQFSDWYVQ